MVLTQSEASLSLPPRVLQTQATSPSPSGSLSLQTRALARATSPSPGGSLSLQTRALSPLPLALSPFAGIGNSNIVLRPGVYQGLYPTPIVPYKLQFNNTVRAKHTQHIPSEAKNPIVSQPSLKSENYYAQKEVGAQSGSADDELSQWQTRRVNQLQKRQRQLQEALMHQQLDSTTVSKTSTGEVPLMDFDDEGFAVTADNSRLNAFATQGRKDVENFENLALSVSLAEDVAKMPMGSPAEKELPLLRDMLTASLDARADDKTVEESVRMHVHNYVREYGSRLTKGNKKLIEC